MSIVKDFLVDELRGLANLCSLLKANDLAKELRDKSTYVDDHWIKEADLLWIFSSMFQVVDRCRDIESKLREDAPQQVICRLLRERAEFVKASIVFGEEELTFQTLKEQKQ